ncbi:MAG: LysM peptidoglycan-binding domain-containing protein [Flavobacterium sp.]|nr:LysM peptidoglycan-binding domain-containing protein [Flavobacterium sp.]
MKKRILFSIALTIFSFVFSVSAMQDKYIKHTVVKGETITIIAQKYRVTPYDIFKLNPDSQNGIQLNSVLLIPTAVPTNSSNLVKKDAPKSNPITHIVLQNETLYSISKQYNLTIEALKAANADLLNNGLKIGQNITIPSSNDIQNLDLSPTVIKNKVAKEIPKPIIKSESKVKGYSEKVSYHIIESKETKYSISKKYGMTIQELERLNPQIVNDFPIGLKLVISSNTSSVVANNKEPVTPKVEKYPLQNSSLKKHLQEYVVKPKETIASIASDFHISEVELIQLNPELKKGAKLGMILRVPLLKKAIVPKKEQGNLFKTINTNARKQLALLFPFNISKLESDTINSTQARLKKDKFLNLTLDFYSGALMAIDSAKVLGLNVDIKILDSQETKNSSNVTALVQQYDLSKMDAIIGPFYQSNVEKLAELVEPTKIPVISPLSKEVVKKFSNLYQSMPSLELLRNSIFDYMRSKGGNIIAVIDPKKSSVKQYIQEMQTDTKIVGLSTKNSFLADSLKVHLQKGKMNYVIIASESTGMILASTTAMLNLQKDFQLQMVIMEPNETLDFEEISLTRLTKLNLLYPSLSRPNETGEANQFDAKYKKINKITPNQYAIRGFDITFDTLLRLSQEKTFEETVKKSSSEQIENKFDYVENTTYGYSNKGIYILYYDTDLTIKEAL